MSNKFIRRIYIFLKRVKRKIYFSQVVEKYRMSIDLDDPLQAALQDAELLIAFSAQSRRTIKPEKIKSLTDCIHKINSKMKSGSVILPLEKASFWIAYDDVTIDMAPLSAYSIRSSMNVNSRTFPSSLLTPTAYNAGLTVLVFFLCLALQGFWVAGKELVDRADNLDAQKLELQTKIARNSVALRRSQGKQDIATEQYCLLKHCDSFNFSEGIPQSDIKTKNSQNDPDRTAQLLAELNILRADTTERGLVAQELNEDFIRLNERSRPLESLLRKWHERARAVCDSRYLRFLCPVDNPKIGVDDGKEIKENVTKLRGEVESARQALEKNRQDRAQQASSLSLNPFGSSDRLVLASKQRELSQAESDLATFEADRFRSIAVEVRIIVANIGAYLIAMVMGLLGALTFILRTLSFQLRDHTYVPVSASISIVRICLGAIAGVFGSLLVPNGDVSLKSLPPLFVPFVFGYGIEILFSLLDKVVKSFTQTEAVSTSSNIRPQ